MKTKIVFSVLTILAFTTACGSNSSSDGTPNSSGAAATTSGATTTVPTTGLSGISVVSPGTSTSGTSLLTTGVRDINGLPIVAGQSFFLRNVNTQACMDLQDGNPDNGGVIQTYDCIANNPNQIWTTTLNADGSLSFISTASGKCLDLPLDQIPAEQNPLQTWDCTGASNQSFFVTASASGGYQLSPVASSFQCVTGNDLMDAETCTGDYTQAFDLIPSSDQDPANAVKVASGSGTTSCNTVNGSGMVPAIDPSQYAAYLLANPILVTSNDQCDQYCDAYNATTCLMSYNASSSNYYCSPLSSSDLMAGSASDFAVTCGQQ